MPSRLPRLRSRGFVSLVALATIAVVGLAGCTASTPVTSPSPSSSAGPTPSATPAVPFSAGASASVALTHFTGTIQFLLKSDPAPHGNDVIGALRRAGFDQKAMEITPDTTTIGRAVDSIEISVLWQGKTCLIGQVGSAGFATTSAPVLSTGKCLVGTTRTIA